MATINLRPSEVRMEAGLDVNPIPKPSQPKRPVEDTYELIWDHVVKSGGATRLEICRAIGRAKTPWLLGLIERMVESGWLTRQLESYRLNGAQVYVYRPVGEGQ